MTLGTGQDARMEGQDLFREKNKEEQIPGRRSSKDGQGKNLYQDEQDEQDVRMDDG
jgi:hypothetical protein